MEEQKTIYPTVEERLQIESLAHANMQEMYAAQQAEISELKAQLRLAHLQLDLERKGSTEASENYEALLYAVAKFVFAVKMDGGGAGDLTEQFYSLEAHIEGRSPGLVDQIAIDQDTLAAEIKASEWADERISSLEDMIAAVWAVVIGGDDPTELTIWKDFETIAKDRLGADDEL